MKEFTYLLDEDQDRISKELFEENKLEGDYGYSIKLEEV